jgi:hypothetical protein
MQGYPTIINHPNCVDLRILARSALETTKLAWIYQCSARLYVTNSWKYRVYVAYNELMTIYPWILQIYNPCPYVYLYYPCISVCIYTERCV